MLDNREINAQLRGWVIARHNPPSIACVVLNALAAVISYVIAAPRSADTTLVSIRVGPWRQALLLKSLGHLY